MSFIVEFILHKYLDKFFYGIDKKNIEAGILDGRISISNIGLQQNLLDNLNFPIKINYSYVEKVELHIPWRSEQTPINIYISNIYALISAKDKNTNVYEIFMKKKQKAIAEGIEAYLQSLKEEPQNQKQAGMISTKIKKLLYNVNINIGCIHFRYEQNDGADGFSFGLKINNINVFNVNKEGKKQFFNYDKSEQKIVRLQLSIDFIGLYVNSKQTKFIYRKSQTKPPQPKSRSFNPKDYLNKKQIKQASKRDYAYLTNQMRQISFPQKSSQSSSLQQQLHYVFIISVKTLVSYNLLAKQMSKQLTTNEDVDFFNNCAHVAIISFDIELPSVSFKITQDQYHNIKKTMDFFSSFQSYWREYVSSKNLVIVKQKNYVDISILLKQKKKKTQLTSKQKFQLKRQCQKYIKWVFLTVYQERLKRSFLVESLKKDITVQNLLKNKKIVKIMRKINEQKLKSWVNQAMAYRKKFVQATSIFERMSEKNIKQFLNKLLGTFQSIFTKKQHIPENTLTTKDDIFTQKPYQYDISFKINLFAFEVSKADKFGVQFLMKNLRYQFLKRKDNYSFEMRIQDLEANVFSNKNNQKRKTIVPIIRKSIIQSKQIDLLFLKYQKNPLGSLYINAQYELDFESIQITIYPEAFKQFYSILFDQPQKKKKEKQSSKRKTTQKKSTNKKQTQENWNNEYQTSNLLLRNKVRGKIRSPWIIFPLGRNNNPQKQCWVVRLGDFNLQTPQIEGDQLFREKQNLYEKYTLQLKQFQLKFFSSVKFFYNWLKFNQNEQALFSIPYYKNMKIINMIKPFTCIVDFSTLKSGLSSTTKTRNYSYISNIHIEGIEIFLSNFLLEKLKQRIDILGQQQNIDDFQFIEQNVQNIYQEHAISGWAKVTNQKWKQMKFFIVLKGHFIYYFVSQSESKYYFFTDVRKTMIRLVGRSIQKINPEIKDEKVSILLIDTSMLNEWKKHITFCIQKKEKKKQQENKDQEENKKQIQKIQTVNQIPLQIKRKQTKLSQKTIQVFKNQGSSTALLRQQQNNSSSTKIELTFIMNRLEIKLKDKDEKQFLLCYFKKSNFTYRCLYSPEASFSLSSWDIFESYEHKQKEIPFLSSKKFYNSQQANNSNINNRDIHQNSKDHRTFIGNQKQMKERSNFLEVKVQFNSITNQLSQITVDIDKFFLAWKVDLITKILTFFFYSSEVGDAPTPYTVEKRTLSIKFMMNRFYCYAYQEKQLAGLIKLHGATIEYYQSNIEEYFDVRFKKLQIDQSINNSLDNRENMLISKGSQNPFWLKYHIRKKNYQKIKQFQPVQNLKNQFGSDTIVTILTCELQDSIVVYEHELTFRMLNYVLSHVLGTVAAKFKKRSYSPKYIYEVLKLQKISTMNIKIKNFTFVIPPHNKNENHLLAQIDQFRITKNLELISIELKPQKIRIPTKYQPINVFYETMHFQFQNVKIFQRFGKQIPIPLNLQAINFRILMSKINLSSDFYNVLNHYDDFDRLSTMKIQFLDDLVLQVQKVTFVTILQIFYQNIKQRDGKAQIFEPHLPYPPKKEYVIEFPALKANLYEYNQKSKSMQVFNKLKFQKFVIVYTNFDTKSEMAFSSTTINSQGQLPIDVWTAKQQRVFNFKMMSDSMHSVTKIQLSIKGYQIDFCFDKLNNLLQFINYDSEYVSNRLMPPKPSSFMCVNVFANQCLVKMEDLWLSGQFLVTYAKNSKNHFEKEVLKYLQVDLEKPQSNKAVQTQRFSDYTRKSIPQYVYEEVADKQIKVDGQNLKVTIKGDTIGQISSLYFHRLDLSAKKSMKRYKKEIVQIGEGIMSLQISDFDRVKKAYEKRIKKSPDLIHKIFYQPWNNFPNKSSYSQKRLTEVQFSKLNIFLVPNEKKNHLFYFMGQIKIPKLTYSTFQKQQQISVDLGAVISQHSDTVFPETIGQIKKLKLVYKNSKQKHIKDFQIGNANQINFYLANLNSQTLYLLSQEMKALSSIGPSIPKPRKYLNLNYTKSLPINSFVTINNTTSFEVTLQIAAFPSITVQSFKQNQTKLNFQQLLDIFIDQQAYLILDVGNKRNSFKKKLRQIQMRKEIQIGDDMIMKITIQSDALVVHLFEGCIVKNNTKIHFYLYSSEDKQFKLHPDQEKCFLLVDSSGRRHSTSHLNIHRRIQKVIISLLKPDSQSPNDSLKDKGEEISLRSSGHQEIFNNLILVHKVKKNGIFMIELRQKFVLCNFTPFKIDIGNGQCLRYKEESPLSQGLYSTNKTFKYSALDYTILINNTKVDLCLRKCPVYFQLEIEDKSESQKSQKMKVYNESKKMSLKIYIKELKSEENNVSYILLYTKIIYQSLAVEKLRLQGRSQQDNSTENQKQGFKIGNSEEIALQQDAQFLFIENLLTFKSELFDLKRFINLEKISQSNKDPIKPLYGTSYFLIQQKVNILGSVNFDPKDSSYKSIKEQINQIRIKITDCCSLANITPFIIKIKSAYEISQEIEMNLPSKINRMINQETSIKGNSSSFDFQLHPDSQQSIPFQILKLSKNNNELASFLQVCFMDLKNQTKFYRQLKISQPAMYYLDLGDQICKVTVLLDQDQENKNNQKDKALTSNKSNKNAKWLRILLELSEQGYKVQNNIQDIVVQVKNGQNKKQLNQSISEKRQRKFSKDISYISDQYQIEDQLKNQPNNHQILVQPENSKNLGIKSFSSKGFKIISLSFYYPLRNIDFKQSVILQLDNLSSLAKKEIFLTDSSKKSSFTILILTEVLKEGKFHIKLYKKSAYQETTPQTLKLMLKQLRLSIYLNKFRDQEHFEEEKIKLELCNLNIWRQKHIDMQNFDVKLQKILLIEGNTQPIIAALDKSKKFLNFQAILQKAPQGLKGKSISVKLTPLEVNGREGILLKLLQKIAHIRSFKIKGAKVESVPVKNSATRHSMQRQRITNFQITIPQANILKQWQLLKKGSKPISLQLLEMGSSSIFLSYTKSQQILSNSPFLSDPILKYFLLLPSIGETKLPIPDFQVKNFNGSTKQLLKLIAKQLKSTIGQSVLYSLTSLSIFDNPIQAVDDLVRYVMTILQTV